MGESNVSLLCRVRATRAPVLAKEVVAVEESKACSFLSQIETLLAGSEESGSPWIFGTEDPTALDAHVVPFVARLIDVGRHWMLQDRVRAFAEHAFDADAWKEVMQGRKTVHATYL